MFKYLYGPVSSWRLGISLGVDLLSQKKKVCPFDCTYCQLGKTDKISLTRRIFVPTDEIIAELKALPDIPIDYYTFSGRGEPTLALNLREVARWIRTHRKGKRALLTNSVLMTDSSIWPELDEMDMISFKLDAFSEEVFQRVNRPLPDLKIADIREALSGFRKRYKGKFVVQIMVVRDNMREMKEIADFCRRLEPDMIHLNTPLRGSPVEPVGPGELRRIEVFFKGLPCATVFQARRKPVKPLDKTDTLKRRGRETGT